MTALKIALGFFCIILAPLLLVHFGYGYGAVVYVWFWWYMAMKDAAKAKAQQVVIEFPFIEKV